MSRDPKVMSKKLKVADLDWDEDPIWCIKRGHLTRPKGRPRKGSRLFKVIGEKLPWNSLATVKEDIYALSELAHPVEGIYMVHDSMGAPRYVGHGNIFSRVKHHLDKYQKELQYFSFYVVADKCHEREIETLLIRGAANMLALNERKVRIGVASGNITDYEPGTVYYERQSKKGPRTKGKTSKMSVRRMPTDH